MTKHVGSKASPKAKKIKRKSKTQAKPEPKPFEQWGKTYIGKHTNKKGKVDDHR